MARCGDWSKSWYQSPTSRVKHNDCLSTPFQISRGVKQGSVLSPSLFLIVMNTLLERMRNSNCGGSLHGYFIGTAVHADDVRCIAPNIQSVTSQSSDIHSITADLGLKLNFVKTGTYSSFTNPTFPPSDHSWEQLCHNQKICKMFGYSMAK